MKLVDVWALAEQCIVTFEAVPDTACVTEDEHIRDFLKPLLSHRKVTEEEATFIRETTAGVLRYRPFLDATVAGYCAARKKNKQNGTSIAMLYYLCLFRFEELGPDAFRRIINKTLSNNRLAEMLELMLDEPALRAHVVPRWCGVFDDAYVENHVLGTLRIIGPELAEVAAYFREKASGVAATAGSVTGGNRSRATTAATGPGGVSFVDGHETFNATGASGTTAPHAPAGGEDGAAPSPPRPSFKLFGFQQREEEGTARKKKPALPPAEVRALEAVGQREEFPKIAVKCTDGEKRCVELTKKGVRGASTLDAETRQKNREREKRIPFKEFSATARPLQLPQLLEEERRRQEAEMRPVTTDRPSPARVREKIAAVQDRVEVKPTGAALLREFNLYKRREEAAEKARLRKEQEMRDDTEFREWKARMDAAEEAENARLVAQRKAELIAGDEAARATRQRLEKENLKRTRKDKVAMDKWRADAAAEAERERRRREARAAELRVELRDATDAALDNVAAAKKAEAAVARDESHRREQAVAVQLELEKQRKQQLIEEIKAAHAAFVKRQQEQHATMAERMANTAASGALEGMTIAQLRQKLADTKAEHKAWEEAQREKILASKQTAKSTIAERAAFVEAERRRAREQKERARLQREEAAATKAAAQQKREEQLAVTLDAKLEAQRAEKKHAQDDRRRQERERKVAAQLLSQDAGAMEALKWAEMERGKQNALLRAQNEALCERKRRDKLHAVEQSLRETNIAAKERQQRERLQVADSTFRTKRERAAREQAEDDEVRFAATKRMMEEARTLRALTHASAM